MKTAINNRNTEILNFILTTPDANTKMIQNKYSLTRNQVDYSLRKINDYLEIEGEVPITRTSKGVFVTEKSNEQLDEQLTDNISLSTYEFSKNERMYFLILMILSNNGELNLMYLSYKLKVSETTVSRDLNDVRNYINTFDLKLENNRNQGYDISGKEWDIRQLLSNIINYIYNYNTNGELLLVNFGGIKQEEIKFYKKMISYIENKLSVKYSENNIWIAPYILLFIIKRVQYNKTIKNEFNIGFNELSDTREYFIINDLFNENLDVKLPNQEKLYITLYLMTLNISSISKKETFTKLKTKIDKFLNVFEYNYAIKLINKKDLKKKLYIHLSSAIYRIKYNFSIEYPVVPKHSIEDKKIIDLVKNTIYPLEELVGKEFPYQEVYFISSLIGGSIYSLNEKSVKGYIFDAVVVCPNGVLFSNLIKEKLKEIIPFINFRKSMSIEEYQDTDNIIEKYDFVFSSVYIDEENVIVIDSSFDNVEKKRIKKLVANKINPRKDLEKFTEKILEIVSSHTLLLEPTRSAINEDIQSFIQVIDNIKTEDDLDVENEINTDIQISDLLTKDNIQVSSDEVTWHEAIDMASTPLYAKGMINLDYIEAMKVQFPNISENILLGKHTVIPHSKAENGSYKLGISLLKLKKPLLRKNGDKIYFVFVVSTTIEKKQLNVMYRLLKLVTNKKIVTDLLSTESADEVIDVIKQFENSKG